MNYDLIALISKLRRAETPEQLAEVKNFGEFLMRKEKNGALLTLMAVVEEFGKDEVLVNLDELRECLSNIMKK